MASVTERGSKPAARPKVGVGVFVKSAKHPGCVLLGKRLNKTGLGTWALPGGHVENCETLEETAIREVEEEVGVRIEHVRVSSFINCFRADTNYHYIVPFLEGLCPENSYPGIWNRTSAKVGIGSSGTTTKIFHLRYLDH